MCLALVPWDDELEAMILGGVVVVLPPKDHRHFCGPCISYQFYLIYFLPSSQCSPKNNRWPPVSFIFCCGDSWRIIVAFLKINRKKRCSIINIQQCFWCRLDWFSSALVHCRSLELSSAQISWKWEWVSGNGWAGFMELRFTLCNFSRLISFNLNMSRVEKGLDYTDYKTLEQTVHKLTRCSGGRVFMWALLLQSSQITFRWISITIIIYYYFKNRTLNFIEIYIEHLLLIEYKWISFKISRKIIN